MLGRRHLRYHNAEFGSEGHRTYCRNLPVAYRKQAAVTQCWLRLRTVTVTRTYAGQLSTDAGRLTEQPRFIVVRERRVSRSDHGFQNTSNTKLSSSPISPLLARCLADHASASLVRELCLFSNARCAELLRLAKCAPRVQICRFDGAGATHCATEHLCILDWLKVVYSCDGECTARRYLFTLQAFIVKPGAKASSWQTYTFVI